MTPHSNQFVRMPNWVVASLIFVVVFIVYICSPNTTSSDSIWSIHTSQSLLKEGNTNLDEYQSIIDAKQNKAIERIGDHQYTYFPIGVSIFALPFVAAAEWTFDPLLSALPGLKVRLEQHKEPSHELKLIDTHHLVELIVASFACAFTALLIFLIAKSHLTLRGALAVTFVFAFCTSSWSTSSRSLWQHGPSMLMLTIALLLILIAQKRPAVIQFAAIALAFSFVIRPTNAIPIVLISLFVFINYRKYFIPYLCWGLSIAVLLLIYNYSVYDMPIAPYYGTGRIFQPDRFVEALIGNLFSPSRGIFIYTPILMLSLFSIWRTIRKPNLNAIEPYLVVTIVLHWLLISTFEHWWAGHSYGARFFADMIPFFIYFLILFIKEMMALDEASKRICSVVMIVLCLFSFSVHYRGAFDWSVYEWNEIPTDIDHDLSRLWDWSDIPYLRE